jgi:ribosome-binding protein aMBF1 (putative translation factor)
MIDSRPKQPGESSPPAEAEAKSARVPRKSRTRAVGEDDDFPVVGHAVRRIRRERGLSLDALAKESGVSRSMLGQIELGQSVPTINVLWKIARAFGVPVMSLVTSEKRVGDVER